MPEWSYYVVAADGSAGRGGLLRVPPASPVSLAEELGDDGRWRPSDVLFRVQYQGADDDVRPVDVGQAENLIAEWVRLGRLPGPPDATSSIGAAQRAALIEADRRARERWAQVEPPPGLDSIRF